MGIRRLGTNQISFKGEFEPTILTEGPLPGQTLIIRWRGFGFGQGGEVLSQVIGRALDSQTNDFGTLASGSVIVEEPGKEIEIGNERFRTF